MRTRFNALTSTILAGALLGAIPIVPAMAQEAQASSNDNVLVMRRKVAEPKSTADGQNGLTVAFSLADPGAGVNTYRSSGEITLQVSSWGCMKDGKVVESTRCAANASGDKIGDDMKLASRMDPDLKAVHVTREALEAALPYAPVSAVDDLCESQITNLAPEL